MVDMNHSVLGFPAKKHTLILSGVFCFFFILMTTIEIWQFAAFEMIVVAYNCIMLAIISPIFLFLGSAALLCLLKCNSKVIVIICIFWPGSIAATGAILLISALSNNEVAVLSAMQKSAFGYTVIIGSIVLTLGSIHCIVLLVTLGFCARGDGGADSDLYDLEKSTSQEDSSFSYDQDKHCIQ